MTVKTACPAKINLFLESTGKREDSYHTLDTVMHTVSLGDALQIDITRGSGKISICGTGAPSFPMGEKNIAYRAAEKYMATFGVTGYDIDIFIEKNTPMAAGLGGGSADAAGVLRALESHFSIGEGKMLGELALSLGADVPFCLNGGCNRARGIGEILTEADQMPSDTRLVIAKGKNGVNTRLAYARADELSQGEIKTADTILAALEDGGLSFAEHLFNRFEDSVCIDLPEIVDLKNTMLSSGALGALMSGSGSSVFGIFQDDEKASAACKKIRDKGIFSCVAEPIGRYLI